VDIMAKPTLPKNSATNVVGLKVTLRGVIPVAISLDLTVPAFAAQSGPRITPKGGVSFYANGYEAADLAPPAHAQHDDAGRPAPSSPGSDGLA